MGAPAIGAATEPTADRQTTEVVLPRCSTPADAASLGILDVWDAVPDPLVWFSDELAGLWVNAAAEVTFGWDRNQLADLDLMALVHPDDLAEAFAATSTMLERAPGADDRGTLLEVRVRNAVGDWLRVEVRGQRLDGGAGFVLAIRDLSDRHVWTVDGGDEHVLRAVLGSSSTPVLVCTEDLAVRSASAAVVRSWGFDLAALVERPIVSLLEPVSAGRFAASFDADNAGSRWSVDVVVVDRFGAHRPHRFEVTDLRADPAVRGYVVFAHDTSDLHEALASARELARTDPLTGLANRSALLDDLTARLAVPGSQTAVLFCDLDGFKAVNDLHGHERGDALLCTVADRLRAAVRTEDLVARLGGDEFVVLCSVDDPGVVTDMVGRVESAMVVDEGRAEGVHAPRVAASVGAVLAEHGLVSAEEALAEADSEMYRAKAWRRGVESLPDTVSERRRLAAEFAAGCDNGEVCFAYQPVVALPGNEISGFETLVRWWHPARGLLTPGAFMPVVEEAGLETRLAAMSISAAVDLLMVTPGHMWVSMNLSPLQLADPDIVGLLADAVGSEDLDPSRFVVEVTESSVLERRARDGRPVVEVLDDIVALGVRLAVDDFGTGASSLSRLGVFPASGLKVDQSFTARLGDDPLGAAVVRAMLSLGAELDCQVVVEGVETVAQLDELNRLGAPYAQGFLFAAGLWLHDAARVADAASLPVAGPYAAA